MSKIGELTGLFETDYDDRVFKRGEIYFIDMEGINEYTRHVSHKNRPALIISNDKGNTFGSTVIVALLTTAVKKDYPFQYKFSINGRDTIVMCEQLLTLDKDRILEKHYDLSPAQMKEVERRLCNSLEMDLFTIENIYDIDVTSVVSKKTKTSESIYFEIEIILINGSRKTISVPIEKLKKFDQSISQEIDFESLKTKLDNCRGLNWLFRNNDI
jgi:mRNA interferase MazF